MKNKSKILLALALTAFGALSVTAAPIRLKSGEVDTSPGLAKTAAASFYAADEGVRVYLVQCEGSISPEWRSTVEQAGGKILGYVPDNAYLVAADPSAAATLASQVKYAYLGDYRPEYKVSASVNDVLAQAKTLKVESNDTNFKESAYAGEFVVSIFKFAKASDVAKKIAALDGCVVIEADGDVVRTRLSEAAVSEVLSWPEVEWLEPYVEQKLFNDVAVKSPRMNVETVWPSGTSNLGLTGSGQVVAVCDTGLDTGDTATLHEDVRGRVTRTYCYGRSGTWSDPDGHGTHVAGSVMGNGTMSSGRIKGAAYEANLIFQSVLNSRGGLTLPSDLKTLFNQAYVDESGKKGARIHSNSWGASQAGYYSTNSRAVDQFMFEHPDMLIFFSAGNDGVDYNGDGVIELDSIGSPATAKNCMTVGAAENQRTDEGGYSRYVWATGSWARKYLGTVFKNDLISNPYVGSHQGMAAFSSRGPCDDGRVKPDIVAPGTDIVSLHSSLGDWGWGRYNDYYAYMGGTSMSTPLTAGAAVLVRQWLVEKQHLAHPDGATVKAVMLAGAKSLTPGQYGTDSTREIPASYPNNVEGWGQVNLGNALANSSGVTVFDGKVIGHGETQEYKVSVNSSGSPLAIVMAYMDAPASLASSAQLVNDLDLTVTTPSGTTLYPNSRTSPDRLNNVEGVRIPSAEKGIYTVKVKAYSVTSPMATDWTGGKSNATRYSVAVNGATQSAALEVSECFLSNQSGSLNSASRVAKFCKGETIYAYGRIHNPGSVDHKDGFTVKHALQKGSVSKGSLENVYSVTIASNGDYDIAHYAWSGLQNLAVGTYTYSFTLTSPGTAPIQRNVSFEVEDSPSPLDSVTILGPSTVGGGSRTSYTCRALLVDGTEVRAEPVWTIDSPGGQHASIDQNGTLTAYATETPRVIVVRATCTHNGVTRSGTKTAAINPVVSLPVALDCPTWTISCGGDAEWFGQKEVTQDGVDAAQSGSISHSQTSWFETSVEDAGTLSFCYRVSTEQNWDKLIVSVDGVERFTASGESDWTQHSIAISGFGPHVVRFAYKKDVSISRGDDAVYLDRLAWTIVPTPESLAIVGEGSVRAGSSLQLEGTARMSDGTERSNLRSECTWEITSGSNYASISEAGLLTAHDSTTDRSVVVKASYAAGGVTKSTTRYLLVTGVAPMPAAPVITRSGAGDYSAAVLGWSAADNATSYRVYRSEGTSRPTLPQTTVGNVLSYRDETVSPGVEYRYWVSAVNTSGETVSGSAVAYRDVQLTVGVSAVSFGAEGGTTNVTVKANADVDCPTEGDWLSASFSAASLTVSVAANDSELTRVGSVTLTAAAGTAHPRTLEVVVSQSGVALPEHQLPDLAFDSLETVTADDAPSRLFDVGDVIKLRYGWKNCGAVAVSGTVTNLIEVGRRCGDDESDSVDEVDIEMDVLTSDEQVIEVDLTPGAARTDTCSSFEWQSLEPGVYIAKAWLNAGESLEESDYYNSVKGVRFAVRDLVALDAALDCENSSLVFETKTDQWYGTKGIGFDGADCAMTKLLGDGQKNVLTATVSGRGTLSFVYKVATEASYDALTFKIDGTAVLTDSGIGEWKQVSFDVEAGEHTFVWTYAKDATGSDGDDCAYLDHVIWTPVRSGEPPTNFEASDGKYASYVRLAWDKVEGALSYVVERADSSDGPWTVVANSQSSPAFDEAVLGGVDHFYRVKSICADGESDWSDLDSGWRKVSLESIAARTVPGIGGSDAVLKEANCIWKATVDCDWLTFDCDCGTNDYKLVYRFPSNDTGAERSCWVTVTGAPGTTHADERTFKVTQRVPAENGTVIDLNEATDCSLVFNNSAEFPWLGQTHITHDGKTAMRSAEISGDVSSRVEVAFARAGKLSFWWGTSSESSDILRFYIGNDEQFSLSGYDSTNPGEVMNWELKTVDIRTNGTVVAWEYSKGVSGDGGLDAGYVSEIVWMPATEEIVPPQEWFDKYPRLLERLETTDLAVAAKMQSPGSEGLGGKKAADGSEWLVWMDYVCGTDPLDSNSKFQATITMEDGVPKVEWAPKLEPKEARLRNYLIYGKQDLKAVDWTPVADGHEAEYKFFKVSVEMQ